MPSEPTVPSLFDSPEAPPGTERCDVLYERHGVVIERITSSGSQPAQTYSQQHDEWVLLARGQAQLRVSDRTMVLTAGNFIHLPADTPHELVCTSDDALWLAVHVHEH